MPERRVLLPGWFVLGIVALVSVHWLASIVTSLTIELMHGVSPFALEVRAFQLAFVPYYNAAAFPGTTAVIVAYLWPIIVYTRAPGGRPASELVRRRVVNAPLAAGLMSLTPWVLSAVLFSTLTIWRFGHWSSDLMSQEVLSPLVMGFLAATTSYLLLDWIVQARVVPRVFPDGHVAEVTGSMALGVHARLLIFLAAVAFLPLFTILGLVRAAAVRVDAGLPADGVVHRLTEASQTSFVLFVLLGIGLTVMLARSFTQHLGAVAGALRRVQAGDLGVHIQATSGDEVGVLADGVNALVGALREKDRILRTFGRVVEPSVRDRQLSGDRRLGGELRHATVLFCDLRGFTTFAEHTAPHDVVAALNEFLTVMTIWVRECGGFVDKFVGDAMLVVFGLFDADTDDGMARGAAAAVRCGLGMRERVVALNARRATVGESPLAASVGIHTGEVLAGTIGAEDRHEYTVIGDTVNVAARLQEVAKEQGRGLLVSAVAAELAQRQGVATELMPLEPVALRGRTERVAVCAAA